MHRILISGYYGFGNVGDESILTSIVDNLKSVDRDIEITVLSANPSLTEARHDVRAVDRKNFFEIYLSIKHCDLFISGGGGLLQDVTSEKSIRYYLGLVVIAKYLNKKVMIYGQGIGPINKTTNKKLTGAILNRVDAITVRDEKSLKDLKGLGVVKPPIYLTADPVVTLKTSGDGKGLEILKHLGLDVEKPIAGFSVRSWKGSEKFNQVIAKTADNFVEELGFQVLFIPFHYGEDNNCIMKIRSMMKKSAYTVDQKYPVRVLLDLIGEIDLMVGVRLHSLIFSAIQGVPMVGISYDPKIDGFLSTLDMNAVGRIEEVELSDLLFEIQKVWVNKDKVSKQLTDRIKDLKDRAGTNDAVVLELINK